MPGLSANALRSSKLGRRFRSSWGLLILATVVALGSVFVSLRLRRHAELRQVFVSQLGDVETRATAMSSLVWRALSLSLANQRHELLQLSSEEQRSRRGIVSALINLIELHEECAAAGEVLGFSANRDLLRDLDRSTRSFANNVQGLLAQIRFMPDRAKHRLRFLEHHYKPLQAAIDAFGVQERATARASMRAADTVAGVTTLTVLLALCLLVWRLSYIRGRREHELAAERARVSAAGEARFRELIRHSSDLILLVEESGRLRFATPSARVLAGAIDPARGGAEPVVDLEQASRDLESFAAAIENAIDSGAFGEVELAVERSQVLLEQAFGKRLDELVDAVNSEVEVIDPMGATRVFDVHAQDLTEHAEIRGVVLNARDVTARKELEERLTYQALHDPLTRLPNRRSFQRHFDQIVSEDRVEAAVLFVDLDGFKRVNDGYGHKAGDELLVTTAARITSCLGKDDLLARQGGDEFLILAFGDEAYAVSLAARIHEALTPPFTVREQEVFITASIGYVTELAGLDADEAAQRADIAMYEAKQAGKACARAFEEGMLIGAPERLTLESDFRRALERGEFCVVYQPKVNLASGRTESLEALVRWQHPTRGFVRPDAFIGFAEESGLISELGKFVLEQACLDATRWQESGVVVSVNLSPVQFRNPHLVDEVVQALEGSGLRPELLELEITESAVLGDVQNTIRVLTELKDLGVRLAIDDFGTGYSNLAHLKHFNVDVLKIDQSFVRGGGKESALEALSDEAIVTAVIAMAKAFGLEVVAEGVESESHVDALRSLGADIGQGYFFSKPVAGEEIDALLAEERGVSDIAPPP